MQLRNKTVSIIGGSGFIGRALVKKLALSGAKINVLTRNAVRSKNLKTAGDVGQVTVMSGDALVDEDIINSIRFADYVVNLIGIFYKAPIKRCAAHNGLGCFFTDIAGYLEAENSCCISNCLSSSLLNTTNRFNL